MRFGIGYDIHPLVAGRKLMLGGVDIPFGSGLEGWSDGDVLTHAVIDALLGAAALGDIGSHFPAGDKAYRGISSLTLLSKTVAELLAGGWRINNIDATVLADEPRLSDFTGEIRKTLAQTLGIPVALVSIKAHSSNGLGIAPKGEAIAVYAIASIENTPKRPLRLRP
ncbi:MAG: 2-C-methyl-D-erythritol 2,4-cyclodiphosphate synthase [Chloroflexota bacterium]